MSALIEPGEAVPTHHELVDGVPVATPALSSAAPDGLAVSHAVGVILAQDQRPIPDVVVVRQLIPRTNNFPVGRPVPETGDLRAGRHPQLPARRTRPAAGETADLELPFRVSFDPAVLLRLKP